MNKVSSSPRFRSASGLVSAVVLIWFLIPVVFSSALAWDDGRAIAKATNIQGKMQQEQCLPFARDLYERLNAAGGEAYLIIFRWEDMKANTFREVRSAGVFEKSRGSHAMVVFRDSRGRYYGMDNQSWRPVSLLGRSVPEWVMSFSGQQIHTELVSVSTNPSNRGQYADLSRSSRSDYVAAR